MNGVDDRVSAYVDWWPRQTEEIDEPFARHGWKVQGGVAGRTPRQLGGAPDFTQMVVVVSSLLTGAVALTQLIRMSAQSVTHLLRKKRPDEKTSIIIDIALDGQTEGTGYQSKWRTGRYIMINLPPDQEEQLHALEVLARVHCPSLPDGDGEFMPWGLVWEQAPYNRWSLRLVLRTRSK